ncbi:cell division protein FtsQ [Psychromonas ingrahamii 37]|uniref:Cell division protein FtsQ n=1 Tax=Psychromonas ingrahamii (strain DSM 17664 / CCUG 51855 / 37) TaxID=357804 RepID=A1SU22_PSYIN|nr:FtsQ-type POTRA domain-containing protein [Psychromonas ingrahamii]ABM02987.1 cell division protein FtsQ [Psychromonas ingrahamii 37]
MIYKLKKINIGKWISLIFFLILMYGLQNSYSKLKSWLTDEQSLPLTSLILTGDMQHVSSDDVRGVLKEQKDSLNFFTLEIAQIQKQLEDMPWVYSASIRKQWPDTIKIHIVEQSIIAIWNNSALLNQAGDIIYTPMEDISDQYIKLNGEDEFVKQVLQTYLEVELLLKVNKFKIKLLSSDKRNSSNIILNNGIALRLGKEQKLDRIQRFLSVFPLIEKKYNVDTIDYLDLRYDTGIAIGWQKGKS